MTKNANSAQKMVLVVDDEDDIRRYLSAALTEAGFDVVTAVDGEEALAKVKSKKPDLISLDLVMPKKSGVKFHRELIKNKEWARIPVIIVTGHARDELGRTDLKELTMSGQGLYLEKPVKPENYIAAVKKLLGMEVSETEAGAVEKVELQNEINDLLEAADLSDLERIRKLLKDNKNRTGK